MLLEICHSPQQGLSSPTVLCYLCVTWGPILSGSHGKNKNSGGHCLLSTYSVPHMILAWHTICSSQKWRVGSLIALKSSTSTTAGCHWALSSSVIRSDHKHPPPSLLLVKILQCRQGSRSGKAFIAVACQCFAVPQWMEHCRVQGLTTVPGVCVWCVCMSEVGVPGKPRL